MAAPGPYNMLAQQHLCFYDALRDHTTKNAATLQAAITAIGVTPTVLVWTFDGDGIWTIDANLTFPATISHWIPPGVVAFRNTGQTLTIQGAIFTWHTDWLQGPGSSNVLATVGAVPMGMSKLTLQQLDVPGNVVARQAIHAGTTDALLNQVSILPNDSTLFINNGRPVIHFYRGVDSQSGATGVIVGMDTKHQLMLGYEGQEGRLVINQAGLGITNIGTPVSGLFIPTHALHMAQDDAFKATSAWTTTCARDTKEIEGVFDEGLEKVLALPPAVWFRYNGKGGTDAESGRLVSFIADEVEAVAPYLLTSYRAKLDPEDEHETEIAALNTSALPYVLINAIKEQQAQIAALRLEVAALRSTSAPASDDSAAEAGDEPPPAQPKKAARRHK